MRVGISYSINRLASEENEKDNKRLGKIVVKSDRIKYILIM